MAASRYDGGSHSEQSRPSHLPVLLNEVLELLVTTASGTYVDATFGRGGHSEAILAQLTEAGRVIAFDRDMEAVKAAQRISDARLTVTKGRFSELSMLLADAEIDLIDGLLMDVGVSSPQLDTAERGFSFAQDGPLDMRMDPSTGVAASDWLNTANEDEIATILRKHGEEKFARRIARAVVAHVPIESTLKLAEIVAEAVPAAVRHRSGKHPATQTFQAIRIHINQEDEELVAGLEQGFEALRPGARLAVISFHSLEDRVVKQKFRAWSQPPALPRRVPVRHAEQKVAARLVAGPVKASPLELGQNPRARSAVLRVLEKCA